MIKSTKTSNVDIVIYALYLLGGWQERIHTEDIALKCFEIAPSKFSWIKYPTHPDLMTTLQALGDAKKPKYGSLVMGESERKSELSRIGGWLLTAEGVKKVQENITQYGNTFNTPQLLGDRLQLNKRLRNLITSTAYKKYQSGKGNEITYAEFTESIVCTVNTRKEIINNRIQEFLTLSEKLKNKIIRDYFDCIKNMLGTNRWKND